MRTSIALASGLIVLLASGAVGLSPASAQPARPVIAAESDVPPTRFPMPVAPSELLNTPAFLTDVLPPLRAEAERLLRDYDIQDPTIASTLRVGLMSIAWLQNRPNETLRLVVEQRDAETKPQLRQIGQMTREALAAGALAPEGERCAAAASRMAATLSTAEPLVVRDEVVARYGLIQTVSPAFHAGTAALLVDEEARSQGSLGTLQALRLAFWRMEADGVPACRMELAGVLKTWLDDPAHRPVDIWPARAVTDADLVGAQPVVAAVWEAGYDPDLFASQLAIDPAEPLDGRDNDGNGVIDDWNGPTFDMHFRPTRDPVHLPSPELASRIGLQFALEKGLLDLNFGEDSPEARFVAQRSRDADVREQVEDVRVSREFFGLVHGTWVAGLIADGAPFVRLYTVTSFPGVVDPDPVALTEEDTARWAASLPAIGARLRGANVRLVNMSWVMTADGIARDMLASGVESDPARAAERGSAVHAQLTEAISALIRDCPDILFVAAAGNTDQSEESARATPQTLVYPNLLVVGGTGITGNPTAFSTYGENVRLYALAEGNRVRAPGGQVMRASGTSFAAPIVVRAAAAMLGVNPELTPTDLIEGLTFTARGENSVDLPLLDAGAALRWARAQPQSAR